MKIIGIIAEYNPFHNGHAYQIMEAKKRCNASACVVIMSGDYVQRGEPAIIDKFTRCQMALSHGADLVLELPTAFATSSAEGFAQGAISILDSLGCIDELVFGAETDNLSLLTVIAKVLAKEPAGFKDIVQTECKKGLPYPKACNNALTAFLEKGIAGTLDHDIFEQTDLEQFISFKDTIADHVSAIMDKPNNILAIQYLKALFLRSSRIKPFLLKRIGNNYHDKSLSSSIEFASATGIRNELYRNMDNGVNTNMANESNTDSANKETSYPTLINSAVSKVSAIFLSDAYKQHKLLTPDSLSILLHGKLILEQQNGFEQYLDVTPEFSDKIIKNLNEFVSFSQFCELLKSKDLTYTRISRSLLHICLNITEDFYESVKEQGYAFYVRPLGFTAIGRDVFKEISKNSSIPIISKLADAKKILTEFYADTSTQGNASISFLELALKLLTLDIQSSQLYDALITASSHKKSTSEYAKKLVIL